MADPIEAALQELDRWYNEVQGDPERPKFLSKLATLEYCGWLEERMDELVRVASKVCGGEESWIEKIIDATHGFHYANHFRANLCKIMGEVLVKKMEARLDSQHPGDLDRLSASLGTLWVLRGTLAHTNKDAARNRQVTLNAPSYALNQQRVIAKILDRYEAGLTTFSADVANLA